MAEIKMGQGNSQNVSLEQHAAARKTAKARNQRVQARKAERQQALAGGGIDLTNLFGI